jgi:hypothetical protein
LNMTNRTHSRIRFLVLAALAAGLALPSGALAGRSQQTVIQDDPRVLHSDSAMRNATLDEFRDLGVEFVKIRIDWRSLAPSPEAESKPEGFDGSSPSEYGDRFGKYDDAISGIRSRGMQVMVLLGGRAPDWASSGGSGKRRPHAGEFGKFVHAVGSRYAPGSASGGPAYVNPIGGLPGAQTAGSGSPVAIFSVWNEPNLSSWLTPQYLSRSLPRSPRTYRALLRAAHGALAATGHGGDTLLLGELAPFARGGAYPSKVRPIHFLRELACVDKRYRPYRGRKAKRRGCKGFTALPGTGLAYHPYTYAGGPRVPQAHRDDASIGQLSRVSSALSRLESRGRFANRGLGLYINEFGYQTRPPDRFATPIKKVPGFMGESEWLAYRNSRVATYSQYPLVDDVGLGGFQAGLRFRNGEKKPGVYRAFQLPLYARLLSSSRVQLFGGVRNGAAGDEAIVDVRSGGRWRELTRVRLGDQGYFLVNARAGGGRSNRFRLRAGELTSATIKPR